MRVVNSIYRDREPFVTVRFDAEIPGRHRAGESAFDRADASVQSEFADDRDLLDLFGRQRAHRHEHAERDRQIEATGVFT